MAETFEPRRFNAEDYMGFGGAEKFKDGSEPLIIEAKAFVLVADVNGIGFYDEESSGTGGWMWRHESLEPLMALVLLPQIASTVVEHSELPSSMTLSAFGFEEC